MWIATRISEQESKVVALLNIVDSCAASFGWDIYQKNVIRKWNIHKSRADLPNASFISNEAKDTYGRSRTVNLVTTRKASAAICSQECQIRTPKKILWFWELADMQDRTLRVCRKKGRSLTNNPTFRFDSFLYCTQSMNSKILGPYGSMRQNECQKTSQKWLLSVASDS